MVTADDVLGPACTCMWDAVTHLWTCPRVAWLDQQYLTGAVKTRTRQTPRADPGDPLQPGWAARQAAQPDPNRIIER